MHHDLKLIEDFGPAKRDGRKLWEYRGTEDRTFAVGDTITFHYVTRDARERTGRTYGPVSITYCHEVAPQRCVFTHTAVDSEATLAELLGRMRLLAADHGPDGWPAVQMRDISALCAAAVRPVSDAGALYLVARIREAVGDNGKRMQDELVDYCRDLAAAQRQLDQAIDLLEIMLRYSDYGTTPIEDDNAVIDARAFLVSLTR